MTERRVFSGRQRDILFQRAEGLCEDCTNPLQPGWHAHHVIPWSKGGATDTTNGQALCADCNEHKGARHPKDPPQAVVTWNYQRLRRARLAKGFSTVALASQLGVDPSQVSRWENGLREPRTFDLWRAWLQAIGLTFNDVFSTDPAKEASTTTS